MILFIKKTIMKWLKYEVTRFLLVGGSTVFIDLICYSILILIGFDTYVSKGISFSIGAIFSYIVNRSFTFQSAFYGLIQFSLFILLYLSTLFLNITSNEILLEFLGRTHVSFIVAFLIATILSASLNFLGMKYIVFNQKKN